MALGGAGADAGAAVAAALAKLSDAHSAGRALEVCANISDLIASGEDAESKLLDAGAHTSLAKLLGKQMADAAAAHALIGVLHQLVGGQVIRFRIPSEIPSAKTFCRSLVVAVCCALKLQLDRRECSASLCESAVNLLLSVFYCRPLAHFVQPELAKPGAVDALASFMKRYAASALLCASTMVALGSAFGPDGAPEAVGATLAPIAFKQLCTLPPRDYLFKSVADAGLRFADHMTARQMIEAGCIEAAACVFSTLSRDYRGVVANAEFMILRLRSLTQLQTIVGSAATKPHDLDRCVLARVDEGLIRLITDHVGPAAEEDQALAEKALHICAMALDVWEHLISRLPSAPVVRARSVALGGVPLLIKLLQALWRSVASGHTLRFDPRLAIECLLQVLARAATIPIAWTHADALPHALSAAEDGDSHPRLAPADTEALCNSETVALIAAALRKYSRSEIVAREAPALLARALELAGTPETPPEAEAGDHLRPPVSLSGERDGGKRCLLSRVLSRDVALASSLCTALRNHIKDAAVVAAVAGCIQSLSCSEAPSGEAVVLVLGASTTGREGGRPGRDLPSALVAAAKYHSQALSENPESVTAYHAALAALHHVAYAARALTVLTRVPVGPDVGTSSCASSSSALIDAAIGVVSGTRHDERDNILERMDWRSVPSLHRCVQVMVPLLRQVGFDLDDAILAFWRQLRDAGAISCAFAALSHRSANVEALRSACGLLSSLLTGMQNKMLGDSPPSASCEKPDAAVMVERALLAQLQLHCEDVDVAADACNASRVVAYYRDYCHRSPGSPEIFTELDELDGDLATGLVAALEAHGHLPRAVARIADGISSLVDGSARYFVAGAGTFAFMGLSVGRSLARSLRSCSHDVWALYSILRAISCCAYWARGMLDRGYADAASELLPCELLVPALIDAMGRQRARLQSLPDWESVVTTWTVTWRDHDSGTDSKPEPKPLPPDMFFMCITVGKLVQTLRSVLPLTWGTSRNIIMRRHLDRHAGGACVGGGFWMRVPDGPTAVVATPPAVDVRHASAHNSESSDSSNFQASSDNNRKGRLQDDIMQVRTRIAPLCGPYVEEALASDLVALGPISLENIVGIFGTYALTPAACRSVVDGGFALTFAALCSRAIVDASGGFETMFARLAYVDLGVRFNLNRVVQQLATEPSTRASMMSPAITNQLLAWLRLEPAPHGGAGVLYHRDDEGAPYPELLGTKAAVCAAVRNLTVSAEHRRELVTKGFGDAIVSALRSSAFDLTLAWPAVGALLGLACEPANCLSLYAAGVACVAVTAMQAHLPHSCIAWAACGLLLKLASLDELLVPLQLHDGAGTALLQALREHSGDARVVKAACAALCRLATVPGNRSSLAAQDAASAVKQLVLRRKAEAEAEGGQGLGCGCDDGIFGALTEAEAALAAGT